MQRATSCSVDSTDYEVLCPNCQTPGGYMVRIPRAGWRRLLALKQKHYLCRECGHKFYTNAADRQLKT